MRIVAHPAETRVRDLLRRASIGVARDVSLGWFRLTLVAPGYLRLGMWQVGRMLRSRVVARAIERTLAVLFAVLVTTSCGFFTPDGSVGGAPILSPLPPELAKTKREKPTPNGPWAYVLPVDHGVRVDESGKGHFRAPRFHGEHNGIDLLAPVGTSTFAACAGQAMAGVSASFGRWVHLVCPVPARLATPGSEPWASFFYAHLDRLDLEVDRWIDVAGGQKIGAVGKTGNARGSNVQPHLHLELIVQRNRQRAMEERHLGNDQSEVPAALQFTSALEASCLDPAGFQPKSRLLQRARRIDPFLALVCLSPEKPAFKKAPEPLEFASSAWSDWYEARDFNVNRGRAEPTARR